MNKMKERVKRREIQLNLLYPKLVHHHQTCSSFQTFLSFQSCFASTMFKSYFIHCFLILKFLTCSFLKISTFTFYKILCVPLSLNLYIPFVICFTIQSSFILSLWPNHLNTLLSYWLFIFCWVHIHSVPILFNSSSCFTIYVSLVASSTYFFCFSWHKLLLP